MVHELISDENPEELNAHQKIATLRNIFPEVVGNKKYVKNVGDYLTSNFEKLDGFDFRWSSLISNNPLLFEDVNYLRIKSFIDNSVTDDELEAYKRGDLRELYATFDSLLICNLRYYDRIMNYCSMVFMHYLEIDGEYYKGKTAKLTNVPFELSLTPTKIWCAVLSNISSTAWELEYAWHVKPILPIEGSDKTTFELSYNKLYKNMTFAKFSEWATYRVGGEGYRDTFARDESSNRKLSQVCAKFTKSSVAISETQLDSLFDYINKVDEVNKKLYLVLDDCLVKMFNGDKNQYSIYIFSSEFFIFTSKFSMKVSKNEKGAISKDYLANSYECFSAEEFLIPAVKMQIEWAKFKMDNHYEYDKGILKSLLTNMLDKSFREIVCIKRISHDEVNGMVSKITFSGVFNNVKIIEEYMVDNRTIKSTFKTLSKKNAAAYIVDRGYYLFGLEKDILQFDTVTKETIIDHYNNYCIPIMLHMVDVINMNITNRNEIIDVLIEGEIPQSKLNNDNIIYTKLSKVDHKAILSKGLEYQNKQNLTRRKSYWNAID